MVNGSRGSPKKSRTALPSKLVDTNTLSASLSRTSRPTASCTSPAGMRNTGPEANAVYWNVSLTASLSLMSSGNVNSAALFATAAASPENGSNCSAIAFIEALSPNSP